MTRTGLTLAIVAALAVAGFRLTDDGAVRINMVFDSPVADTTLVDTVSAGSVLIRMLPETLGGMRIPVYRGIAVPVRGWLYHRSFFWRVPSDARGPYSFMFAAASGSPPDTLRLDVIVTEPSW